MAVKLRLTRVGSKKNPIYRVVVADSRSPRDGRFIQKIGFYNPLLPSDHADRVKVDFDVAKEWLKKGATASDRVHRMLSDAGCAIARFYLWADGPSAKVQADYDRFVAWLEDVRAGRKDIGSSGDPVQPSSGGSPQFTSRDPNFSRDKMDGF